MLLKITLKKYLLKVFHLREDELKKTLLLQLNIFLLITTLLIVKPTINSLFLSELSSNALPLGYILTAISAIIGSMFYDKILEKFALNTVIEYTLIGSVLSLVIFGIAFNLNIATGHILFIPYIWVAIFGLLTASQFWILANLVYNVREAKRVFGFIGAGAIAGGIFGGYLTSILTKIIRSENLLFVAALFVACCLPIVKYIWKNNVVTLNTFQVSLRSNPKDESPFTLIKQDKLLTLIALVIGISVIVAKLVDYQYSDYASKLIKDEDQLTSFFGFWFSTLSVISLIIQLFLTQKIVAAFGVGKSLLLLPIGIITGSILLIVIPQLWVIIFIKIIDGSFKQSVNKAATELLSIPIPIDTKKKTKTFTDVVIDSIATGLAGLILLLFINALNIASTYISLIIIALISVWLYFIYHLQKEYIISFKKLFENPTLKKEKTNKKEVPVTHIIDTVKTIFLMGTESQILHMLQKTLEVKNEAFFFSIKNLTTHKSAKVRALAIENLYFLKTENLSFKIEKMVFDEDQLVTTSAFRYLLKNYENDTIELFNKYLKSKDTTIANAALIGLSLELRNNTTLQERFSIKNRLLKALKQWDELYNGKEKTNKIIAILEAIGNARVEKFYTVISEQLNAPIIKIQNVAITSAGKTLDPQFINQIIQHLSAKKTRKHAIDALFYFGEPIISILEKKILQETIDLEDAIHVIAVIEKFASQKAIYSLLKLTDNTEHIIKIEAIDALKRLKWNYPNLRLKNEFIIAKILDECQLYQSTLAVVHSQIVIQYKKKKEPIETQEEIEARNGLIHLLEQRLDRQLIRIFSFLGIKYPPNDVDSIFSTILNGKEEQRIHAIEFLDNILDTQLKKELLPIAESVLIDSISEEKIKKLRLNVYSEFECYQTLLTGKDFKLKQAVLYLIEKTHNKTFLPLLKIALNDRNEKIRKKATEITALLT
jgi:AAA family ATP:ADP antiporter